jgi:MFS family permease
MAALVTASLLSRLPIGINGLAIVLFLREETGSFAVAGAAAGALALGNGLGGPLSARVVDRLGYRALSFMAVGHAAGLVALFALGSSGAAAGFVIAAAALAGVVFPPTSAVLRALYPRLVPDHEQGAYALDSVITESIFIAGPLLVGLIVAVLAPGVALIVSAGAVVVGTLAFVAALPVADEPHCAGDARDWMGALRAPGIRTLVAAMAPVGFAFGALEVALPAFADEKGSPELAGLLIAIWSIGSLAGGLVYGVRTRKHSLATTHLRVALLLPVGFVPIVFADSIAAMAVLVIPAGVLIAPLIATRNELTGHVAPEGFETEAFTWPVTALVAGIASGAAVSGSVVEAGGWQPAILIAAGAAALGALVSLSRRSTLEPASATA